LRIEFTRLSESLKIKTTSLERSRKKFLKLLKLSFPHLLQIFLLNG